MRYYAAWICRFVSVDPLQFEYPHYTPYQYAGNKPITFIDLDGAEEFKPIVLSEFIEPGTPSSAPTINYGFENGTTFMNVNWSYTELNTSPMENSDLCHSAEISTHSFSGQFIYVYPAEAWIMQSATWTTETVSENFCLKPPMVSGAISSSSIAEGISELASNYLSYGLQKTGMKEKTADKTAGIAVFVALIAAMILGMKGGTKTPTTTTTTAKTGTNAVYRGVDAAGKTRYVGITGREASVRFGEHAASGTARSTLQYEVIKGAEGLTRTQARIWEQNLINQLGLQKNGGQLFNMRNSIAPQHWWQYGIIP